MTAIIVILVLILIAYLAYRVIAPKKRNKKNPGNGRMQKTGLTVLAIAALVMVGALAFYYIRQANMPVPDGEGAFYNVAHQVSPKYFPGSGDTIEVAVSLDSVTIGRKTYTDSAEIQDVLYALKNKGCDFILIDDYALNRTYVQVKEIMNNLGIVPTDEVEKVY